MSFQHARPMIRACSILSLAIATGFAGLTTSGSAAMPPEHRAVWIQNDANLSSKLDKLRAAHFNVLYFGVWGAKNMSLEQVIDLAHSKGFDVHLWEANAYICAGQWIGGCTNKNDRPEWFARFPNGMSRKELFGEPDYFDFGVPEAKEYSINVMVDYLKNYAVEGVHFDYIRYDGNYRGNYSFNQANLDQFEARYGIKGTLMRGDSYPVFALMHGNRVDNPTTARVLAEFHDGVPAILLNDYKNGHVLLLNWKAFYIYSRVPDELLKRAIQEFGASQIYVAKAEVNSGRFGPFFATTNWLKHLGHSSTQTTLGNVSQLPAGSLLVVPGIYLLSSAEINNLDSYLSKGGDVIFIDGPTTTIARNVSQTFKDILGVNSTAPYLGGKALITVPTAARDHKLMTGLVGSHQVTYAQARDYIDKWYEYMQSTVTDVVKGVSERARQVDPEAKLSAAVFPAESGGNLTVHQDWPLWMERGYLDYVLTMGYTLNMSSFTNRLDWLEAHGLREQTIPGLGVHNFSACGDKDTILSQIELLRGRGFHGFSIFDSRYMTDPGQIPADCKILQDLSGVLGEDVEPYYPSSSPIPTPTPIPRPSYEIGRTLFPPIVDGSEWEYQDMTPLQFADNSGRGGRDNRARAWLLWDEANLYLAVSVEDTQLVAEVVDEDGPMWDDDAVEVFIDPKGDGGTRFGSDDYRIAVNLRGVVADSRGLWDGHAAWDGHAGVQVRVEGTVGFNSDLDRGYTVELFIPWADLGITPTAGTVLGLDVAVDDRDLPEDGYQYSDWAGLLDFNRPQAWGRATLSAEATGEASFADVPDTHEHFREIERLYRAGYVAGCAQDPLRYCPDQPMVRTESAVFVERGVHGVGVSPPDPDSSIFADMDIGYWGLKWAAALYQDGFTTGCGTDPVRFCPEQSHTRAEGAVFFLRMRHGLNYAPPAPQGIFTDVPLDWWGAKWAEAAYDQELIPACGQDPLRFCPDDPLTRDLAAFVMIRAKELTGP